MLTNTSQSHCENVDQYKPSTISHIFTKALVDLVGKGLLSLKKHLGSSASNKCLAVVSDIRRPPATAIKLL